MLEVKCDPKLNSGVQCASHFYEKDGPDPLDSKQPQSGRGVRSSVRDRPERDRRRPADSMTNHAAINGSARSSPKGRKPSRTMTGTSIESWFKAIATAPG